MRMVSRMGVALALTVTLGGGSAMAATTISGFVDASYAGNLDTKEETFGLDQVEVDIVREIGDRAVLRADLEWVKSGEDGEQWDVVAEQGILSYVPAFLPELTFSLGKFNAPIGFEQLDAPDMYQYSHSLVFDHCLPTNLTGAMFGFNLTPDLDVVAYVANGWDRNQEHNDVKTFGGRVGYSLGELGGFGVSLLGGYEGLDAQQRRTDKRTVIDLDVALTPLENLIVGGELNLGTVAGGGDGADDPTWTGFLIMAHYEINEWLGITGRFDMIDDPDAYLFGAVDGQGQPLEESRTSFTIAPTFVLGDGMGALIELRVDGSSEDRFPDRDGELKGTTTSVAFEMTYTFGGVFE